MANTGNSAYSSLAISVGLLLLTSCGNDKGNESSFLANNLTAPYDYYINGMQSAHFDRDGRPLYALNAERATHFPADNHAELIRPELLWHEDTQSPWTMTAYNGVLRHNNVVQALELNNAVSVRASVEEVGQIKLETSAITVQPATRTALSDAAVSLTTHDSTLTGVGMQLDLSSYHLQLHNDVRGTHAP